MNYSEKLKDPRWQRKRLEILNRDEFRCKDCYDDESTLHVHHLSYAKQPWDTKNEHLITLCERCHHLETTERYAYENMLLKTLKEKGYFSGFLRDISSAFDGLQDFHGQDVMGSIIEWAFSNHEVMLELREWYFDHLAKKRGSDLPF